MIYGINMNIIVMVTYHYYILYIYSINIHMISPNLHVFRKKSAFLTAISYLVRGFNPSEKY